MSAYTNAAVIILYTKVHQLSCACYHYQVTDPLLITEMDCTTVHEAVFNDHAACLHFQLARSDIIPLSTSDEYKGSTPLHLINHGSTPFCYEAITAPLLASMPAAFVKTVINTRACHVAIEPSTALHNTECFTLRHGSRIAMRYHYCVRALLAAGADPTVLDYDPPVEFEVSKRAITVTNMLDDATLRQQQQGDSFDIDEWVITAKALQAAGLNFHDPKILLAAVSGA
jgi:hypothetical protein